VQECDGTYEVTNFYKEENLGDSSHQQQIFPDYTAVRYQQMECLVITRTEPFQEAVYFTKKV